MTAFNEGEAWAEVDGREIPISSYEMQYKINDVPSMTLKIPYGYDQEWLADGYSKYSDTHSHDVYRHIEVFTDAEDRRIFNGYITDTVNMSKTQYSEKGSGVRVGTVIKGKGMLALLGQDLNKPTEWSSNSWSGNPFLSLDPGINSSGVAFDKAASSQPLDYIVMSMLYAIADWNEDETSDVFGGSNSGASIVKWVINGNSSLHWDGYKKTFGTSSELNDRFNSSFRGTLGTNLIKMLQSAYNNPFQVVQTFCKVADFALVPVIDGFYVVPSVRPAGGSSASSNTADYAAYYPSDYESFRVSNQMRTTSPGEPGYRAALMIDEDMGYQGGFGVEVDTEGSSDSIVGGYDLNRDTYNDYSIGATKNIGKFGWIPDLPKSDARYIANRLCRQYVIDSQFSGSTAVIQFPDMVTDGNVDESPGSLVKVRGHTADPSSKPHGEKTYYGFLKAVQYSGRANQDGVKHNTQYILSHVMTERLHDQIGITSHPICEGYATTLGNTLNIFQGG